MFFALTIQVLRVSECTCPCFLNQLKNAVVRLYQASDFLIRITPLIFSAAFNAAYVKYSDRINSRIYCVSAHLNLGMLVIHTYVSYILMLFSLEMTKRTRLPQKQEIGPFIV